MVAVTKKTAKPKSKPILKKPPAEPLSMEDKVERLTEFYTEEVKKVGQKYGKLLDVKVLITVTDET